MWGSCGDWQWVTVYCCCTAWSYLFIYPMLQASPCSWIGSSYSSNGQKRSTLMMWDYSMGSDNRPERHAEHAVNNQYETALLLGRFSSRIFQSGQRSDDRWTCLNLSRCPRSKQMQLYFDQLSLSMETQIYRYGNSRCFVVVAFVTTNHERSEIFWMPGHLTLNVWCLRSSSYENPLFSSSCMPT